MSQTEEPAGSTDKATTGPPRAKLSAMERQAGILESIRENHSIRIADIVRRFDVSEVTARSDLERLDKAGKLRRTRGGACTIARRLAPSFPEMRLNVNAAAKRAIGRRAASMVADGDLIAVDAGTTTREFVRALSPELNITLVTYDLDIATLADSSLPNADVIMPGGMIRKNCRYFVGPMVRGDLQRFHFDKVFLGTDTFSSRQGFGTMQIASADIKECMIRQAHWHAVLMDATKVRTPSPVAFATLEDIDAIIMDADPNSTVHLSIMALVLESIVDLVLVGGGES